MARSAIWMGQTMPLAILMVAAVLQLERRRPVAAAIVLGLVAFKPHVALALGLGLLLTGNLAVPLGGFLVAVLLVMACAAEMGRGTFVVLGEYAQGLLRQYSGPAHFRSETNLREMFEILTPVGVAGMLQAMASIAGLGWLLRTAWRAGRDRGARAAIVAGALLWGLASLPFQRFSVPLALPAWGLLLWSPLLIKNEERRGWLMVVIVAMHVLDLPLLLRLSTFALTPDPFRSPWTLALHRLGEFHSFDVLRVTIVLLFIIVMRRGADSDTRVPGTRLAMPH
jgi:hypothetical protein